MPNIEIYKLSYISKIFDSKYESKRAFYDYLYDKQITYFEIKEKVFKLATLIKNTFNSKGENVLLFLNSGVSFVIGLYAIILSGNVPLLVNNKLKSELSDLSGFYKYIVSDSSNYKYLKQFIDVNDANLVSVDNLSDDIKISSELVYEFKSSDKMLYLFTSGSTGQPKLVQKTFLNMMVEVEFLQTLLHTNEDDMYLPLVPSFHIYGLLFTVLLPLYVGGSIRIDVPFSPSGIVEDGLLKNANIVIANPTQYMSIIDFMRPYLTEDFAHIKYCISSTMAIDTDIVEQFYSKYGIRIVEVYGSTETGGIAYRKFYENSFWRFFPYVEWSTTAEDNVLEVLSPAVSLSENSSSNWYVTGDIIEGGSEFTLLGRINQIIKTAGNRVSALEVENVIKHFTGVADVVVVGAKLSDLRGESIIAYIVPTDFGSISFIKHLKEYCYEKLPDFKVPKYFVILNSIPRGANNKVLFNELPKIEI